MTAKRSTAKKENHYLNQQVYNMFEFPKDKNGIIYVRQSSIAQMQKNIHSFEMQTDKFVEHFRNIGCTGNIEIIADDEAMSGTLDIHARPGMTRMVKKIENGEVGWIGAVHVNRLTRDPWLITPTVLMKTCHDNDVWIATLRMQFNFKDSYCQRVFMIEAEEAARHLEWMRLVLGGGKSTASNNGYYDGRYLVPGYIVDRTDPRRKKYIVYEPHADVVKWLFYRFLELDGNLPELVREVEKMPYLFPFFESWVDARDIRRLIVKKTESGYRPTRDGIKSILTNPVYIGWWIPVDGGVVKDNHEPIIEEGLFVFAHKKISTHDLNGDRQKPERIVRNGKVEALLKKVVTSLDDSYVYASSEKGGLYRSGKGNGYAVEHEFSIKVDTIDAIFSIKFFERLQSFKWGEDWEDEMKKRIAMKGERDKLIKRQIREAELKMQTIMELLSDIENPLPKSMKQHYIREYEGLEGKKEQLEKDLQGDLENEDTEEVLYQIRTLIPKIIEEWDNLPFEQRIRLVNAITRNVIMSHVAPGWVKFEIEWKLEEWGRDIGHIRRISNRGSWSQEEDDILRDMYANEDAALIIQALPYRTWRAIKLRAEDLGLRRLRGLQISNTRGYTDFIDASYRDIEYAKENDLDPSDKNVQWCSPRHCAKKCSSIMSA